MSDQLRESLSAALDDAADEFELRRVLDETSRNDSLRDTFGRFQLIKSTLRSEVSPLTLRHRSELQRRVREALDVVVEMPREQPATLDDVLPPAAGHRWQQSAAVAGIAFLAVLGVYFGVGRDTDSPDADAVVASRSVDTRVVSTEDDDRVGGAVTGEIDAVSNPVSGGTGASAQDQTRHEGYLQLHDAQRAVVLAQPALPPSERSSDGQR
jgi:sigma-E factor negative regulatory protein RseA